MSAATPADDPTEADVPVAAGAPAEVVGPLARGIAVLHQVSEAGGRTGLADVVRSTGLARSTVDRVTATLARMGYVRLYGTTVRLAPRVMELGNAYLGALGFPERLGPFAEQLAAELDASVSLSVPDLDGVRVVHQTTRRRPMPLAFRIGDLLPAERTAPGPLFAASWTGEEWARWRQRRKADPEGRHFPLVPPSRGGSATDLGERAARAGEDGWAVDDQLIEPGLIGLAAPVRDACGTVVCAVAVISHTSRHSADSLRRAALPRMRRTVVAMERELLRPAPAAEAPAAGPADWTAPSKRELGAGFIASLARGLTVVTAFGEGRSELTATAIATATGLSRATARRALRTLEQLGCATARGPVFRLTPRVLALGYPPLSVTTLPEIAAPHLAALVRQVHDSASLAVLDGDDIRYTARVATERIMSVHITIGTRFPAYAASMGRVLLAGLPAGERAERLARVRPAPLTPRTITRADALAAVLDRAAADGYALVDGELEDGLRSLAVPVHDRSGRAVAALNVAMHSSRRTTADCLRDVLPQLRATAARVEADLCVAGRFTHIPVV
ncbi:IclR family transcriptional regulator C-terminal domain-containing protein [Streptomyces sp. NPDC059176]|uniref:IclR family transcriptional regulator domain-containing protein n=1 Tax=unclassified Streptomyces TaxID=2593676 RepID=UPI00368F28BA